MTMTNAVDRPVAFHAYLTDASGGRLPVFRLLQERCPECGRAHPNAQLGVTHETRDGRAETVQCLLCDFQSTRSRVIPHKRMNDGQR